MDAEAEIKPSGLRLETVLRMCERNDDRQQVITHATTLLGLLTALRESTMKLDGYA